MGAPDLINDETLLEEQEDPTVIIGKFSIRFNFSRFHHILPKAAIANVSKCFMP